MQHSFIQLVIFLGTATGSQRRTVFTQRLVSGHVYDVNMAITS